MRTKKKTHYIYREKNLFNSKYNMKHINVKIHQSNPKHFNNSTYIKLISSSQPK